MGIIPGGPMPGITGYIIPGGGPPMAIPIISLGRFESGSPMLARPGRRERKRHIRPRKWFTRNSGLPNHETEGSPGGQRAG